MREIIVIAHNLRSCHNVGSLLRTAEGLGVAQLYFTGYTPYPPVTGDTRLPHVGAKLARQIHKTALGAEAFVPWEHAENLEAVLGKLRADGFVIVAVEQAPHAIKLPVYQPPAKIALLFGREVEGVEPEVLARMDAVLEIPMFGRKESYNVVQAAAMALYHCRFASDTLMLQ